MDISRYALSRHTCKAYDPVKKIPQDQVEQIKTLLRYSPSSVNSQPWHFVIASSLDGKEMIAKSAQEGPYSANAAKIMNASHVVVFCARTAMDHAHIARLLVQEEADGRFPTQEGKEMQNRGRNYYVNMHRYDEKDTQHWMEKQLYLALATLLLGGATM